MNILDMTELIELRRRCEVLALQNGVLQERAQAQFEIAERLEKAVVTERSLCEENGRAADKAEAERDRLLKALESCGDFVESFNNLEWPFTEACDAIESVEKASE